MRRLKFVLCPADPDVWMRPAIHNGKYFQLKEELVEPPKFYLGGTVCKNAEEYLEKRNDQRWTMPAKAEMSLRSTNRPELDITHVHSPVDGTYYQSLTREKSWIN
eukprot:14296020-Ditylum_brightwellii.AAC.1